MPATVKRPLSFLSMRNALVVGFVALLSAFALSAWAEPGPGGPGMGGLMMFGGPMSGRMLARVNATADQRAQIKKIFEAARADLKTQREAGKALHDQALTLFTQTTIDANAVEALRQQMLQQHDQATKRMSQAMIDAANVLTPDQRKQLAADITKHEQMMKRHMEERRALDGEPKT